MGQMTKAEIEAAMDQITNCVVTVKVPRLTADEIEELTRPKKRRAKKRYSTLDFSDDRSYFQKACTQDIWYPKSKRKYNGRKRKKSEKNEPPKKELPSYLSESDIDVKPSKKFSPFFNELATLGVKEEVDPSLSYFSHIKTEPKEEPSDPPPVWKIRIKSAYELGSNVVFVDTSIGSAVTSKLDSYQPVLSDLIKSEAEPKLTESSTIATKFNVHTISNLYREFFTNDNRAIIRKVAEVLLTLTESIKKKNDKLTEINCSRSTDAEKLMLRHQAHNEFNRIRDANHSILKKQFEAIGRSLNRENFEILFQLFFLGIMKMLIVSVSNKKGTLFKKIVSLLSQSLSSCDYQNERILNLLRSKDFRADCTALVHFLEKYSETKFFDMLFISDSDKKKILNAKNLGDRSDTSQSSSRPSLLSVNAKILSIMKFKPGMKILPVGSNLLLQTSNTPSIQPKVDAADFKKNKLKITSALVNSMNSVKHIPLSQIAPKISVKKPVVQPIFNVITGRSLSTLNPKVTRTKSVATPLVRPPPYSISYATENALNALNALQNSRPSNSSLQSRNLLNSHCSTQSGGLQTNFSSCAQPMSTFAAQSSGIQTSCTYSNCSSASQSSISYINSSGAQPASTLSNSSNTMLGNYNQSASQATPPANTSNYPFVLQTSSSPLVSASYAPNVVISSSHAGNRSHSVIVSSGNTVISVSQAMGALPTYSVTNVGSTARAIVQPSPPLPQLLPPVVPPLQPQLDTVSACEIMQSSSPVPQVLVSAIPNLHSQPAESISRCTMQPSSPLAQLQPPAVPTMVPLLPAEPAAAAGRMQSSPPLPALLPPAVPNIQPQPVSHAYVNTISNEHCQIGLPTTSTDNRSELAIRTYGSAKEANKRVQLPFDQNGVASPHHFIVPEPFGNGLVSSTVASPQANGAFSPYRTISPAGNCENIQPHSPHSLLHQNSGDSGSRMVKDPSYMMCPTTSSPEGLTLRTLLMDNGRAPLVNQNGPIEASFQYAEKTNFSLDLPPVMSTDSITDDTLVTSHFPMANYGGNPFSS